MKFYSKISKTVKFLSIVVVWLTTLTLGEQGLMGQCPA